MKPKITKNICKQPINWHVMHPDGHIYVVKNIADLLASQGKTEQQLEAEGWIIDANYWD